MLGAGLQATRSSHELGICPCVVTLHGEPMTHGIGIDDDPQERWLQNAENMRRGVELRCASGSKCTSELQPGVFVAVIVGQPHVHSITM